MASMVIFNELKKTTSVDEFKLFPQSEKIFLAKNRRNIEIDTKNCPMFTHLHLPFTHTLSCQKSLLDCYKQAKLTKNALQCVNRTWQYSLTGPKQIPLMVPIFCVCQLISLHSKFHFCQATICCLIQKER